jgi:hypothetical protein
MAMGTPIRSALIPAECDRRCKLLGNLLIASLIHMDSVNKVALIGLSERWASRHFWQFAASSLQNTAGNGSRRFEPTGAAVGSAAGPVAHSSVGHHIANGRM